MNQWSTSNGQWSGYRGVGDKTLNLILACSQAVHCHPYRCVLAGWLPLWAKTICWCHSACPLPTVMHTEDCLGFSECRTLYFWYVVCTLFVMYTELHVIHTAYCTSCYARSAHIPDCALQCILCRLSCKLHWCAHWTICYAWCALNVKQTAHYTLHKMV